MSKNQEETKKKKLANLRPQKPGEPSHNPKGRPKGSLNFNTIARRFLENPYPDDPDKLTYYERAIKDLIVKISLPDSNINDIVKGLSYITDRIDGKPKEMVENKITIDDKEEKRKKLIEAMDRLRNRNK